MHKKTTILFSLGLKTLLIFSLVMGSGCTSMPTEELQASVELVDIETGWEKKYYQPWPPKLILVPAISFKLKNISEKPLTYIYCNAIFKFIDENENLGDNFIAAVRGESLQPGASTDSIKMLCYLGVEGKNVAHFQQNPAWKTAQVKVFLKSKGSQYILMAEQEISRTINFKEPEPVGIKKSADEEEKK